MTVHAPWKSGPVYGHRPSKDPYRLVNLVHDRCKRNAVHLFKTQGWVIDIGPVKHGSPTYKFFEISGFSKPFGTVLI